MDWRTALGLLAGAINVAAIIPYLRDVVWGSTKPNIVTWSLWTLIGAILSSSQYQSGASWTLALIVGSTLANLVVTLFAIRYGQRHYGWIDAICFIMALIAIVAWWWTENPVVAIVIGVAAEFCAASPTIVKAFRRPETETPLTYGMATCAGILSVAASTKFDLANLLFPIYSILSSAVISLLAPDSSAEYDETSRVRGHRGASR